MFMYRSPFGLPLKQSAEEKRCAGLHRTSEPKFPLHGSGAPGLGAGSAWQAKWVTCSKGTELVQFVPWPSEFGTGLGVGVTNRRKRDSKTWTRYHSLRTSPWASVACNASWNGSSGTQCTTEVWVAGAWPTRSGQKIPSRPGKHCKTMAGRSGGIPRSDLGRSCRGKWLLPTGRWITISPISSAKKAQRKLANLPMVENAVLRGL